jgi:cobalamin-dependent methionine synthase I
VLKTIAYPLESVEPYINWLYFFYAWQLPSRYGSLAFVHQCQSCQSQWLAQFPADEQPKAREALHLFGDAQQVLQEFRLKYKTYARLGLFDANSDGDNIIIYKNGDGSDDSSAEQAVTFPFLRQQHVAKDGKPNLCLADFIRPAAVGKRDRIGVFATTVDQAMEDSFKDDPYRHLLAQTLSDRLAEATSELLHQEVRTTYWGYAPEERLSPQEMFQLKYQGIRPAVGYPSMPDQSVNFIIDNLIGMKQIGITVTETGAMKPHGSVSGLMFSHPKAVYFAIGKIGEDQLRDYAERRGLGVDTVRKFLASNL